MTAIPKRWHAHRAEQKIPDRHPKSTPDALVPAGLDSDDSGRPARAEVVVHGMAPEGGERWTTRCPTGRTIRALPRAGDWTIEVRRPGHPPVLRTVAVGTGPLTVTIPVQRLENADLCQGPPEGTRAAQ